MEKIDFNRPYKTLYEQDGKTYDANGNLVEPPKEKPKSTIGGDGPDLPPHG